MYLSVEKKNPRLDPMEIMKQKLHIISSFIKKTDLPAWFRGCSEFQWYAMDALQNSIRDDVEQATAHRVRECLIMLGITPMVHNRDLQLVMMLSGGNDLAFLWFLMESFYKTPTVGHYSLNEQLLLSSIAHLDMITTLRGLDRALPRGHQSKRQMAKRERRMREEQELVNLQKSIKVVRNRESPYFEKLPTPLQISSKALTSQRPDLKANIFRYEIYKDPNYVPPNERNRWFKEIDNPSQEVREHLDNIFKRFEHSEKLRREISHILDMALERMEDLKISSPPKCLHHQLEEEKQRRAKSERQKEFFKNLERTANSTETRQAFMRKRLEKDIAAYELGLRRQRESCGRKSVVRVLGKEEFCEFFVRDSEDDPIKQSSGLMLNGNLLKRTQPQFWFKNSGHRAPRLTNSYCEKYNYGHMDPVTPDTSQCYFEAPKAHKPYLFNHTKIFCAENQYDMELNVKQNILEALGVKHAYKGPKMMSVAVEECFKQMVTEYKTNEKLEAKMQAEKEEHKLATELKADSGQRVKRLLPKSSKQKRRNVVGNTIKSTAKAKCIAPSPTKDPQKSQRKSRSRTLVQLNDKREGAKRREQSSTASNRSTKKAHTEVSTKKYMRDKHTLKRVPSDLYRARERFSVGQPTLTSRSTDIYKLPFKFLPKSAGLAVDNLLDSLPPDMPILSFYDCEDMELMHRMLKIALTHLAKDPKYVLAGLPESHKLPLLREWIYQRYGKRYTKNQRLKSFEASVHIFDALDQLQTPTYMLTTQQVAKIMAQNYSCREYIMKKVKHLQNRCTEVLNANLMRQARTFWLTLRCSLCEPSPRNIFFAYYSSRLADIKYFRTWKPYEFNNVQKARQERQHKKLPHN